MLLVAFLFKAFSIKAAPNPSSLGLCKPRANPQACALQVLCMLLVTFLFKAFSIKAARGLHNSMLARLLRYGLL